jgi:hypothetical protein
MFLWILIIAKIARFTELGFQNREEMSISIQNLEVIEVGKSSQGV